MDKTKCKNLGHWKKNNECYECIKRRNGCEFKHILIDENIILELLESKHSDKIDMFLDQLMKKYMGYMTDMQTGRIIKRLKDEISINSKDKTTQDAWDNIVDGILRNKIQIIKTQYTDESIMEKFVQDGSLRSQPHDWLILAAAISNKLDIVTFDSRFVDDEKYAKKVSETYKKYKIKITNFNDFRI